MGVVVAHFLYRFRHVKCDEEKPSCRKCIRSGRVCQGYGTWGGGASPSKPTSMQLIAQGSRSEALPFYQDPTPVPGVSRKEQSYFEYFCNAPTLKLAGIFKSEFWNSLVVQASIVEPAVPHATIALASAHRSHLIRCESGDACDLISHDSFTLLQYNRAIEDLNTHLSLKDPQSLRVAAVSCVVFMCLEMLRGEHHSMQIHFQHGKNLLRQMRRRDKKHSIFMKPDPQSLDDHLVQVFMRLNVQFLMLGYGSQQKDSFVQDFHWGRRINVPRLFSTVLEMRQSFDNILSSIIYMIRQAEKVSMGMDVYPPPPTVTLLQQQRELQAAISDWTATYDASIPSRLSGVFSNEILGLRMLRIYKNVATIMLSTCFSIKETSFDSHASTFESIITQSKELAVLSGYTPIDTATVCDEDHQSVVFRDRQNSSFTVDMGYFPPLYYTALKCRIPHLRRRAVKLLQQSRHTEGFWRGPLLARIATHIIDMEEKGFVAALHTSPLLFEHPDTAQSLRSAINVTDSLTIPSSKVANESNTATLPPSSTSSPSSFLSSSTPSSAPFNLAEFSRSHWVRFVSPQNRYPFGLIDSGKHATLCTLICSRFRHELGKNGGWEVNTSDVEF